MITIYYTYYYADLHNIISFRIVIENIFFKFTIYVNGIVHPRYITFLI